MAVGSLHFRACDRLPRWPLGARAVGSGSASSASGRGLLLTTADGKSRIADHAAAPADGIDRPTHARKRFTVGD